MPRNRWKNQSGAFDLPSILVGVVVVGILTAGVFAAIFGVIPFAQDRAAKQDLASVSTAQGAAYTKDGGFLDKAGLVAAGLLGSGLPEDLDVRATADGECYTAVGTAGGGGKFIASSEETSPRALAPADTWCDGTPVTPVAEVTPEPVEPEPVVTPEPMPDLEPVMISTWNTTATTCNTITLPITGFTGTVDWGDGTVDSKTSHTYTSRGQVKIRIDGTFDSWGATSFDAGWADATCLRSVDRWEATETTNLQLAFYGANNLRHVESIPASTTSLNSAFYLNTSNFTIGTFDTSNVTNMGGLFYGAKAFNQPLSFNTSKVTAMNSMFYGAAAFNQPLNFTDTSNVTDMSVMFRLASAFNQPLNFDTSNVTDMTQMFLETAAFNQPLNFTDTSSVKDMSAMFYMAAKFDQPLTFDTSNVTNMASMFVMAAKFNQPLSFDTSNVTSMETMFYEARVFNQDLSGWDVGKVTDRRAFNSGAISWKLPQPIWNN